MSCAGRGLDEAEAAVVGYPHDIKGRGIYAYVTLMAVVDDLVSNRQNKRGRAAAS